MIIDKKRYKKMIYKENNSIKISALSLGLWYNFGYDKDYNNLKEIIITAFNNGITHFDVANNYGPPVGYAEIVLGKILNNELKRYRNEIIISTKAGYDMWKGPYGKGGSKKHLISSLDESLKRMNLDYVDIFYHHKYDKDIPLEETMEALAMIVYQGKALYLGLSNYPFDKFIEARKILNNKFNLDIKFYQPKYSLLEKDIKNTYLKEDLNLNIINYSSLDQGLLSNKYLNDLNNEGRIYDKNIPFINLNDLNKVKDKLIIIKDIADKRNQTISQLALSWLVVNNKITSSLIGISNLNQLEENLKCLNNLSFTKEELEILNNI